MGLQLLWSFGLACLDLHALRSKKNLQNPVLVSLFVVGDWVTSILSLAAACAAAGVTVLFARDLHYCRAPYNFPCSRFQISIALAFISWFLLAISSHVMFWLLAAVSHFSSMPLCPAHRLIAILCCNILVFEVKSLRKTTLKRYVMSFLTSFFYLMGILEVKNSGWVMQNNGTYDILPSRLITLMEQLSKKYIKPAFHSVSLSFADLGVVLDEVTYPGYEHGD
ncbi:CASP-LIKE PROTEIN 5B3 [Salix viminalis]|uniref:CASP-like protein n=1 Tax=Salix viminalis TaxID=40686 RepID=A0A9Q0Z412_SALVM|nr:CASP-LIKE PROTEIN 5B3 [Salix viminalis]